MEWLNLFSTIISALAGLVSIIIGITKLAKNFKTSRTTKKPLNRKSATGYTLLLIIGLIIIGTVIYAYQQNKQLEEVKQREKIRHVLTTYRDKLYKMISDYTEIDLITPHHQEVANLIEKVDSTYRELSKVNTKNQGLGLKIYKLDHLVYFAVLNSSLESVLNNRDEAIYWADIALDSSSIALKYINEVNSKLQSDKDNEALKALDTWIESDQAVSRIRYLRCWAIAIKLAHNEEYTTPQHFIDEISKIKMAYIIDHPLNTNPQFQIIEERFDATVRSQYFNGN